MVAAIGRWPEGRLAALHRTYFAPTGGRKAEVDPNRMMLGPVAGGAVWLAPPAERIALAEGIETGLSVQLATGLATWAVLSVSNLPSVVLPPLPLDAEVVIAADNDAAGLRAAYRAAERFSHEGRCVRVAVPRRGRLQRLAARSRLMTANDVRERIDSADEARPEPPRPLRRELPPAEEYPVDALLSLAPTARAIQDLIQSPLALCGQSVLAVGSLVTQAHVDVRLPYGQERPLSLFDVEPADELRALVAPYIADA